MLGMFFFFLIQVTYCYSSDSNTSSKYEKQNITIINECPEALSIQIETTPTLTCDIKPIVATFTLQPNSINKEAYFYALVYRKKMVTFIVSSSLTVRTRYADQIYTIKNLNEVLDNTLTTLRVCKTNSSLLIQPNHLS